MTAINTWYYVPLIEEENRRLRGRVEELETAISKVCNACPSCQDPPEEVCPSPQCTFYPFRGSLVDRDNLREGEE